VGAEDDVSNYAVVAKELEELVARGCIPDLNIPVGSRRHQSLAVRAQGQRGAPLKSENLPAGLDFPNAHAISIGSEETLGVRTERNVKHVYFETLDRADRFTCHQIPNDCGVIMTGGGEALPIRAERQIINGAIVSLEGQQEFRRLAVPDLHGGITVTSRSGDACPVRTESHSINGTDMPLQGENGLFHDADPAIGGDPCLNPVQHCVAPVIPY